MFLNYSAKGENCIMSTINKILSYIVYLNSNFVDPNISYLYYVSEKKTKNTWDMGAIVRKVLNLLVELLLLENF